MRIGAVLLLMAGVAAGLLVASTFRQGETKASAQGRVAAAEFRRTWDGKPNLAGLWQSMSTAYRNLEDHGPEPSPFFQLGAIGATPMGQGVVEGKKIPYQPWAAEKRGENFRNRWSRDPELRCYLPGIPRAMYMPHPFQIVHGNNEILMAFPFAGSDRVVHMARPVKPVVDSWMGTSNGRWEGDTLVIETTGFNDATWFDRAGNFHSEQLRLLERITPVGPDAVRYEVTFEDPKVFTRPWTMRMNLYRLLEENLQLQEFKCVPFAEELIYGYLRKYPGSSAQTERTSADAQLVELMGCVTGGNLQPVEQPFVLEPAEPFELADVVRRDATLRLVAVPTRFEVTGIDMTPWLGKRVRVEGVFIEPAKQVAGKTASRQIEARRVTSLWGTCPSRPSWTPLPQAK